MDGEEDCPSAFEYFYSLQMVARGLAHDPQLLSWCHFIFLQMQAAFFCFKKGIRFYYSSIISAEYKVCWVLFYVVIDCCSGIRLPTERLYSAESLPVRQQAIFVLALDSSGFGSVMIHANHHK